MLKVVILAGGFGTRISEHTELMPKPMIRIGDKPVIWHIMNSFAAYGFKDFVIALGYKAEVVKEYFLNYTAINSDFSVDLDTGAVTHHQTNSPDWKVTLIDTGLTTMTGGRVKRIREYVENSTFFLTYGDGLSDVNIEELLKFHKSQNKLATVTAVRPAARFGELDIDGDIVRKFEEKPQLHSGWINGGFFVLEPEFIDFIDSDETMLEREPLDRVAKSGQLTAFRHEGFWQCMDTKREHEQLEKLWKTGAPWVR